jgi:hypothetical protein
MAESNLPTLLDLAKSDAGIGYNLIQEAVTGIRPELQIIPADTLSGLSMTLTVNTALPTVGFRLYNQGGTQGKPTFANKIFEAMPLDIRIPVDRSLAESAKDQGRFLENQAMPYLEAALDHVSNQFWYGIGNDANGFPGMIAQYGAAAAYEVDAGGNSAKTSAWFLAIGRERIEFLYGNGRTITFDGTWKEETIYDADNNPLPGLTNWIRGRVGMRLANKRCAVRIKNVEEDTLKLTDALMFAALRKFRELKMEPTHIFMNPRSQEQLRASRTATNVEGRPAPLPRDFEGIPIIPTVHITNEE